MEESFILIQLSVFDVPKSFIINSKLKVLLLARHIGSCLKSQLLRRWQSGGLQFETSQDKILERLHLNKIAGHGDSSSQLHRGHKESWCRLAQAKIYETLSKK
jgi:hypothetical protein